MRLNEKELQALQAIESDKLEEADMLLINKLVDEGYVIELSKMGRPYELSPYGQEAIIRHRQKDYKAQGPMDRAEKLQQLPIRDEENTEGSRTPNPVNSPRQEAVNTPLYIRLGKCFTWLVLFLVALVSFADDILSVADKLYPKSSVFIRNLIDTFLNHLYSLFD